MHFCNRTDNCSLVCEVYEEEGLKVVNVPNILLQKAWCINVYAFDEKYTKYSAKFNVKARTKPEDYIYTETEIKTWEELEERVAALEEGGGSADLSDYYTKEETDTAITDAIGEIQPSLKKANSAVQSVKLVSGTTTESLAAEVYHLSVDGAADTAELISITGVRALIEDATGELGDKTVKKYVDDAIADIDIPEGGGAETPTFYYLKWNYYQTPKPTEETKAYLTKLYADYITNGKPGELSNIRLVDENNSDKYYNCYGSCRWRTLTKSMTLYFINSDGQTVATHITFDDNGVYSHHESKLQNAEETESTAKDWIWVENWWDSAVSLQQAGYYQHIKIVGYYGWDTSDSFTYELSTSYNNTFNEEQGARYYVAEPYQSERGSLRYYWNNENDGLYFYDESGNQVTDISVLGFYYWG